MQNVVGGQPDGAHEELEYEYSDDWHDKVLGTKTAELGEIAALGAILVVADPDDPSKPSTLKENKYDMPPPEPGRMEELRSAGKLLGDVILYNGDGDFKLAKWLLYKDNPEEYFERSEEEAGSDDDGSRRRWAEKMRRADVEEGLASDDLASDEESGSEEEDEDDDNDDEDEDEDEDEEDEEDEDDEHDEGDGYLPPLSSLYSIPALGLIPLPCILPSGSLTFTVCTDSDAPPQSKKAKTS